MAEELLHLLMVWGRHGAPEVALSAEPGALPEELAQRALQVCKRRCRQCAFARSGWCVVLLPFQARPLWDADHELPGGSAVVHADRGDVRARRQDEAALELKRHGAVDVPALDHHVPLHHADRQRVAAPPILVELVAGQVRCDLEEVLHVRDVEVRGLSQVAGGIAHGVEQRLHGRHQGLQRMSWQAHARPRRERAREAGRRRGEHLAGRPRGHDLTEVPQHEAEGVDVVQAGAGPQRDDAGAAGEDHLPSWHGHPMYGHPARTLLLLGRGGAAAALGLGPRHAPAPGPAAISIAP
mmetsp:Transcript_9643/g.27143  ORF Transcript_9643/g.27143 Transcript_9643/m.27143 type:complete len:296 (+) Transcript_9643:935-1822(+)